LSCESSFRLCGGRTDVVVKDRFILVSFMKINLSNLILAASSLCTTSATVARCVEGGTLYSGSAEEEETEETLRVGAGGEGGR